MVDRLFQYSERYHVLEETLSLKQRTPREIQLQETDNLLSYKPEVRHYTN